ncbi:Trp biosynthesis-associated membrane protein [Pseudarthrobacter sp. PS3-L1]|uniref:Trp biosynthesis-associated membrane protein n=1 Tax=Pseudarthrobacter sp. PS3-L1 TaxID=3046207 RepID=UPI0024B8A12D|nr:Trp biosynthesis-associated membrane protein [Pseudarthrobacter sp. PS3-L1]MDJ0320275.1 Trp biosynthesis-associated membrane protein [Pseudarthrobacter sp. PS3-L1]
MSTTGASAPRTATPVWARKSTVVLVMIVLSLAVFFTTTQTWLTVQLDASELGQNLSTQNALTVQGSKAATAVTALALAALAGGIAVSIAGKIARWIVSAIIVAAAAGIIGAAATVLADPLAAAQGSIAAATGVSGGTADVSVTVFPVLAVVAGALLVGSGVLVIPAARYWKTRTRYDAAATRVSADAGPVDEIDSWDRLSRGDDPT